MLCFLRRSVLLSNLVLTIPLFDGYQVKQLPYREYVQYIQAVFRHGAPLPAIPKD